jgi:NADPH:quinone reductase-like Zn-dependent oxidoreductase
MTDAQTPASRPERNTRVIVSRFGGPEVLQIVEEPIPEPAANEVRLRILVTGVSGADVAQRIGLYPALSKPGFAPGYDVVGIIDKLGSGVTGLSVGQRVAAMTQHGGYANYLCWRADDVYAVPEGVDAVDAVAVILNYVTSYQMLHRFAHLQPGQRVLIHSAGGGCGTALLQLGRLLNLTMYGTASANKHELVRSLGGQPIDYKREDFVARVRELSGGAGVAAVFDAIGGSEHTSRSYATLAPQGKLVLYGIMGAANPGGEGGNKGVAFGTFARLGVLKLRFWDNRSAGFYSVYDYKAKHPDWFREDLTKIFQLLAEKKIAPVIAARLPLREAVRAHKMMTEQSAMLGKIVLVADETLAKQVGAGA